MTLAISIRRQTRVIKELTSWLMADAQEGGYATLNSMAILDLTECELGVRLLAEEIRTVRERLVENTPENMKPHKLKVVK